MRCGAVSCHAVWSRVLVCVLLCLLIPTGRKDEPDEEVRCERLLGQASPDNRGGLYDQGDHRGGPAHASSGKPRPG